MGWQPGKGNGTGEEPAPNLPGRENFGALPAQRDPRLTGFARDGEWDACRPSAALAAVLEAASGDEGRCPGASHDEMVGLLRRWAALESWAVAGKLAVLRALIREDDEPLPGGGYHGDLPDGWTRSLTHEVALALAMPAQSAETLLRTAWDLQAVLPGIGALLADGTLTYAKARAVDDALSLLSDEDAVRAEAMIVPQLPGKTYGQVEKLAVQAAITVDPESEIRRRQDAERNRARIALRRDPSGAASLAGYDLPADETLAAHASVCARAAQYKESGVFAGVRMDQLRALAYLDILNGITAEARIVSGQPPVGLGAPNDDGNPESGPGNDGSDSGPGGTDPDGTDPDGTDPGGGTSGGGPGDRPDDEGSTDPEAPRGSGPAHAGLGARGSSPAAPPPRLADLVIPLTTLLGLAERPGEGHGLGPLDPGLCRALAATAANSPHTTLCVTVTNPDGVAIGHGCARSARHGKRPARAGPVHTSRALAALPARLNLTMTAACLAGLTGTEFPGAAIWPPGNSGMCGPGGAVPWAFAPTSDEGPPDGYGSCMLTLPDGRQLTVNLEPVPTFGCDHRHESHGYQPGGTLRHLVQVRDGECTFPTCSRHARESDFEHATPYDKGGRTCGCNAGARSRACHQVKQSPGWTVIQPRPGWHEWSTPAGRVYTQGPKRYPVLGPPRALRP